MCLHVKQVPANFKLIKAEKNIVVYKQLSHYYHRYYTPYKEICTPFQNKKIKFNFWGKCVLTSDLKGYYFVIPKTEKFFTKKFEMQWKDGSLLSPIPNIKDCHNVDLIIEEGIHAYKTKDGLTNQNFPELGYKWLIHKAIIPKGSYYFIGTGNDIVADKMIIYRYHIRKRK